MKILIYKGDYDLVKQSGVGQAIEHQEKALKLNNMTIQRMKTTIMILFI